MDGPFLQQNKKMERSKMKMDSIKIENFKAIRNLEYVPTNKVAVLCAPNGTGKSSFLEAVRFGLTGDSPDNCVNDYADETTVSITLNEDLTFSRTKHITKPTKVRVNGKATTAKNLETVIADETGITKDVMRVTTSQDILSVMKPDELGTFLMSYVPEEIDFDTLLKYIPGITADAKDELAAYLPAMPIKFGLDTVDEAYKRIFETRSFAKKDKENREAQINIGALEPPARSLEDIQKEEMDIMRKEGAQSAAKAAQELYDAAVLNRKKAEENLNELQKQIDAITATKPNDEVKKDISIKKAACRDTISKANSMIATLLNNIEVFKNTIENLNKPVCPISEKLVCTTDKSAVKEELQELVTANEEGVALQKNIIEAEKKKLEALELREAEWNENAKAYAQKATLVNRYTVDKKNLPEIPVCPTVIGDSTDYSVRKAEIKEEKKYCEAYERNQKMISEGVELKKKYDVLNFLCKALEPKGAVINGVTSSYLSVFEDVINKRADELKIGYSVQFISENGVNYNIKTTATTTHRPYNDLSHGEQLIAVFLLLDMLNTLCGTRILLLDDVNHLDSKNFDTLFALICSKTLQDDYDHIFLCAAVNADIEKQIKATSEVDLIF